MELFNGKLAIITGASSGIGRAVALSLGARGCNLLLVARRKDRLEAVAEEIKALNSKCKIQLLAEDINSPNLGDEIKKLSNSKVDILINNAGLALGRDKVENAKFSDFEQMITTNIIANFKLVHLVLPWMLEHGEGDILNLCSVAGHYTYQGGAVYCATKHAVKAFTRVLREETCGRNIRVMQISPGMVNTEFSTVRFHGDKSAADAVYSGMKPLLAEDIARMITFMLSEPRHVVIDEIITMPTDQGSPTTVVRKS